MEKKIIRLPQVLEKVGLKQSTIYKHINLGGFPKPIKLGGRANGWLESDIDQWLLKQAGKPLPTENQDQQSRPHQTTANTPPLPEIIKAPLGTELLRPDEVTKLTGHKSLHDQAAWLTDNRWQFHTNSKGEVIIGRMYARLKMCGVDLSGN